MRELSYPAGVEVAQDMMTEIMNEEFGVLYRSILIAIFLVFLVMAMQFESPRFSFMVMMCIPFSLVGSIFLLFIVGATISMVSLMGFLMLVGIVVNNGILYVDTVNQLKGGNASGGCFDRCRSYPAPSYPHDHAYHHPLHGAHGIGTWKQRRNDAGNGAGYYRRSCGVHITYAAADANYLPAHP